MAFWTHLFVACVFVSCLREYSATRVRLIHGGPGYGTVQIYHNGWGTICDDEFDTNEAKVICRMLGYSSGSVTAHQSAHFGQGTGPILLDDLTCGGYESDIANCRNRGWGVNDCSHREDAGVTCHVNNPCASNHCSNGGTCNAHGNSYSCSCRAGFNGQNCQNNINECASNPCRNGGTCQDLINQYRCSCVFGYKGADCKIEMISHQLIGGRGNFEGVLDLKYNGNSGIFCRGGSFTNQDATVICKMSGFSTGVAEEGSTYGQLNYGNIWTGNMGCSGTESHIRECTNTARAFGHSTTCSRNESVGVICSNHTSVRLEGSTLPYEGRVEVYHNGVWGTVCGSQFTQNDANVICHILGFKNNAVTIDRNVTEGQGPVWLKSLGCSGSEADIEYCTHGSWDNHTCDHTNDVSIKCQATKLRLNGGSGDWDGTLEINYEGNWRTICDPDFGQEEARVVCNMLGYNSTDVKHYIYKSNYFGDSKTGVLGKVKCLGNEKDISQCVSTYETTCPSTNAIGLKCDGIQVRLADGPHQGIGRVEVLHNGQWGSVCDTNWDDNDAIVICKMLSSYPFESQVSAKSVSGSFFGRGKGHVWLSDVECTGSEADISNCSMSWSNGVNCDHSNDAGVICSYPYQKRLTDGRTKSQGRVEFLESGTWNSYCNAGWNKSDVRVICREIGYWNTDPVVSYNSTFGKGRTNYIVKPQCVGNEGSFEMCRMEKLFKSSTCSATQSVGVECQPISADKSNVRIVDGPGPWLGRLEIKSCDVWGSICHDSWDTKNALKACQTLGFNYLSTDASSFEIERGLSPMHVKSLVCNPSDLNIGLCTVDFNVSDCEHTHSKAVGIDCSDGINATLSNTYSGEVIFQTMENDTLKRWSICFDTVDKNAAKAICSMVGYQNTNPNVSSVTTGNPVLFTNVTCSGTESHLLQCDTIRTGPTCSRKAAVNCFGCLKTFNTDKGNVVSQDYPKYQPNTDCLIIVKKQPRTPLKLEFHDLNLAGDGDFVDLKDDQGKQLGYFTTNTDVPILASKDGFVIRLNSNNVTGARGFNVSWSPLVITDAVHMGCASKGWNVTVNSTIIRHLYPDTGISQIKLAEQFCTGDIIDDLVVFRQSYTKCSTTSKSNNDTLMYYNHLVYPESRTPFPVIVRGYRWKVSLQCNVSRVEEVSNNFQPNRTIIHENQHVSSSSHYKSDVSFFTDGTFYKQIFGNPISLKTGDNVYVSVKMNSDDVQVKMRLHTCYTKPDPNADASLTYPLIENGCVTDPDTNIISQGTHETRFVFNAFEFPKSHDSVYIFCNSTFCKTSDSSDRCTQVCNGSPSLVGRSLRSLDYYIDYFKRLLNIVSDKYEYIRLYKL